MTGNGPKFPTKTVPLKKKVKAIYLAKCKDLGIPPTKIRETRFQEIFEKNCSGTTFDMSDQGLGANTSSSIATYLAKDTHYTSLLLSGNMVQGPGAAAFAQLLLVNTTITHLDLRSNDIDTLGGIALFKALETNQTLTSIDLSGGHGVNRNHLGGKCADAIARVLQTNSVLYRIYLSENGLGSEGVVRIATGIGSVAPIKSNSGKPIIRQPGNTSLGVLELGHNSLGSDGCAGLCRALVGSGVEELLIPGNHIGDAGITSIAELLYGRPPPISVLDVASNSITHKGVKALAEALKAGAILSSLNLSNNTLGHAGMRALAESINHNAHLTTLVLAQAQIDSTACEELAESIRHNYALTKLDIHGNRIADEGASALAEALEFDQKLIFLDIAMNRIGDEGGSAIATMVHHNTTLRHLELRNNDLRDASAAQLAKGLQTNRTLLHMGVETNDFEYRFLSLIEQRITENQKRYKAEAITRYKQEILSLRVDEEKLHRLTVELHEVTAEQLQKEQEAKVMLQEMESIEEKYRQRMATLHDAIQEGTKAVARYETKQVAVLKEISRFKAEKELKVRNLVAKIHKERDTNQKLEKKVSSKTVELREMQAANKLEVEKLSEQLRVEMLDRKQAESEADQVKLTAAKSHTTLSNVNSNSSTKETNILTVRADYGYAVYQKAIT